MKERESLIIKKIAEKKGISVDKLQSLLEYKAEQEDILLFLVSKGVLTPKEVSEFISSGIQLIDKKNFSAYGISFEDSYVLYQKNADTQYLLPYIHMSSIERVKNKVTINMDGIRKIDIVLENEELASVLVDIIAIQLSRVYSK